MHEHAPGRTQSGFTLEVGDNLRDVLLASLRSHSRQALRKLKEQIMSEVNDALADLAATVQAEKAEIVAKITALEDRITQGQDNTATLAQIAEIKAQVQGLVVPEEQPPSE